MLGGCSETLQFLEKVLRFQDPDLKLCQDYLLAPADDERFAAFRAAVASGDVEQMMRLGTMPDLPHQERYTHPVFLVQTLYNLERCVHVYDVLSRELGKLDAILDHLTRDSPALVDAEKLAAMVAEITLGDAVGCACPPGTNAWHMHTRRFDLLAHEILSRNNLRTRVAMQFVRARPPGVTAAVAEEWERLLKTKQPYPVGKE